MLEQHVKNTVSTIVGTGSTAAAGNGHGRARAGRASRRRRKLSLSVRYWLAKAEKKAWKLLISILDWRCPCCKATLSREQVQTIKQILKPGDLLLETNNIYPAWQIAVKAALGCNWTHSAFYPGGNTIIDSGTYPYVAKVPLDDFLNTSHIAVLRPRYKDSEDLGIATAYVLSRLGKPFNITFDHNNQRAVYCAQLLSNALEKMPHPINIARSRMLWRTMVSPRDLETNPEIDCLWSSHPRFLVNLSHHWPLLASIWLGIIAGRDFGPLGIAGGAALSVWLLSVVSKRLQGQPLPKEQDSLR